METTVSQPLNPAQIHFLQSLSFIHTEKTLNELKQIISDFYFKQMEKETDKWWKDNDMTDEKLEKMVNFHYRTPYK